MFLRFGLVVGILAGSMAHLAKADLTVDFDDLTLAPDSGYIGPGSGTDYLDAFGSRITLSSFTSRGTDFVNRYNNDFLSWSGFAYSNRIDTLDDSFTNQLSSFAGSAHSGSNFAVASGYDDLDPNLFDTDVFTPTDVDELRLLPSFTLPNDYVIKGLYITSVTYTALTVRNGNAFARKFGAPSGDAPDFLRVTAYGIDANDQALANNVEFYLADYRAPGTAQDYIVNSWQFMDLSSLAGAKSIHFNVYSSDVGIYGMNTPALFAIDSIQLQSAAVPEPSTWLALTMLAGGSALKLRRQRRRRRELVLQSNPTNC